MSVSLPFSFHAIPIHPFLHQTLNASPVDVRYMVTDYQNSNPKTKLHL